MRRTGEPTGEGRKAGETRWGGQRFYTERLQAILEPEQTGRFVAIEPEARCYFIGGGGSEVLVAARKAIPGGLFYLKRIGHEFTHRTSGRSLLRREEE